MDLVKLNSDNRLALQLEDLKIPSPGRLIKRSVKHANDNKDAKTLFNIAVWTAEQLGMTREKIRFTQTERVNGNSQSLVGNFNAAIAEKAEIKQVEPKQGQIEAISEPTDDDNKEVDINTP